MLDIRNVLVCLLYCVILCASRECVCGCVCECRVGVGRHECVVSVCILVCVSVCAGVLVYASRENVYVCACVRVCVCGWVTRRCNGVCCRQQMHTQTHTRTHYIYSIYAFFAAGGSVADREGGS